jgi:MFS family permease
MSEADPDETRRALLVVAACAVCQTGLGYGYALSGPLAPFLLDEFGWSRALLASAQTPQIWIIGLGAPLVGFVTVRYGARVVLAAGGALLGVAFVAGAGIAQWWHLAAVWALQGAAVAALGDIAVGAVVTQWTTRWRALALGFAYTGSNIGGFLATQAFSSVAEAASWRTGFFVLGLAALVLIVPVAWFGVRRPAPGGATEAPPESGVSSDMTAAQAVRTRSFWVLVLAHVAYWLYLLAVLHHLVLSLIDAGISRSEATTYFATSVFLGGVSKILFGLVATRMTPRAAILLDFALLATSALALLYVAEPLMLWAFVVLFGVGYGGRDLVAPLAIADCFGVRNLAQIYGVVMLTFLASPLGAILAGYVRDVTGSYDPAYAAFAAMNALAFVLLLGLRDERSGAANAQSSAR